MKYSLNKSFTFATLLLLVFIPQQELYGLQVTGPDGKPTPDVATENRNAGWKNCNIDGEGVSNDNFSTKDMKYAITEGVQCPYQIINFGGWGDCNADCSASFICGGDNSTTDPAQCWDLRKIGSDSLCFRQYSVDTTSYPHKVFGKNGLCDYEKRKPILPDFKIADRSFFFRSRYGDGKPKMDDEGFYWNDCGCR